MFANLTSGLATLQLLLRILWHQYWEWFVLVAMVCVAFRWPLFADSIIRPIEKFGERFATRKTLAIIAIMMFVITLRVSLLPYFPVRPPAVHDEYSYLLASDTFSHGHIANRSHPMWVYFDTFEEIQHPTYASMLPPAQGGFLAIGQVLGHPWIGVLISVALMFGALLWMLQGWFPPKWALLGAILPLLRIGIFSYWTNSYWGGSVATLGSCLVLGSLPRLLRSRAPTYSIVLVLGAAILLNSRPYEGFFVLLAVFGYIALWSVRNGSEWRSILPRAVLPLVAGVLLCGIFIAYYNFRVTGDALLLPHVLSDRQYLSASPFAWASLGPSKQYSNNQFDVMYNHWARNIYQRSWSEFLRVSGEKFQDFFGFFLGSSMAIPFVTFPWVFSDRRVRTFFLIFALYIPATLVIVWFLPHYAAPVVPVTFALIVQMFRHLRRWEHRDRLIGIGLTRISVLLVLIFFVSSAAVTFGNPRGELVLGLGYEPRWDRQEIIDRLDRTPGQHLVIVRYSDHHRVHQDWVFNAADIDNSKIVWAREIPQIGMQPLLDYYKNRQVWLITPDDDPRNLRPYVEVPQHDLAVAAGSRP
jgi:hypothetical protein